MYYSLLVPILRSVCRLALLCFALPGLALVGIEGLALAAPPPNRRRPPILPSWSWSTLPLGEAESPQARGAEEQALAILDRVALQELNQAVPDLQAANRRLEQLITRQGPQGENYSVMGLSGSPAVLRLGRRFPASARAFGRANIRAGPPGQLALAGRVDRYSQTDFLDDYIDMVAWKGPVPLFVTIAGRGDELRTGVFTAWLFDGHEVNNLWTSDILQQSSLRHVCGWISPDLLQRHTDPDGLEHLPQHAARTATSGRTAPGRVSEEHRRCLFRHPNDERARKK